jgi:hypothetical protein
MPMCKYCGVPFTWGNDGERWVPLVPAGQEAALDRTFQDENGLLRAAHRDICVGFGPSVKVAKLAKKIKAAEIAGEWSKPDPATGEVTQRAYPYTSDRGSTHDDADDDIPF